MFSAAQIVEFQEAATRKALRAKRQPSPLLTAKTAWEDWRKAPFAGTYVHDRWKPVVLSPQSRLYNESIDPLFQHAWTGANTKNGEAENLTFFVDSTGLGSDGELALSVSQQKEVVEALFALHKSRKRTIGVALIEVGQFQAVVGVFEKLPEEGII